jgi:hypothetical protein
LPFADILSGNAVCCACVSVTVNAGVALNTSGVFSASPIIGAKISSGKISRSSLLYF